MDSICLLEHPDTSLARLEDIFAGGGHIMDSQTAVDEKLVLTD